MEVELKSIKNNNNQNNNSKMKTKQQQQQQKYMFGGQKIEKGTPLQPVTSERKNQMYLYKQGK